MQNDLIQKVEALNRRVQEANLRTAKIQARLEELQKQKDQVEAEIRASGVLPENLDLEIEKITLAFSSASAELERELTTVESELTEAEKILQES